MSHRYATRSTTPVIDLTSLPRPWSRSRNSRILPNPTTSSNSSTRERVALEPIVEVQHNNSVHTTPVRTDRQVNVEKETTTVPCFNVSFNETKVIISCRICLEGLSASREPMATRCGHIFCSDCLFYALLTRKYCPACNSIVKYSKCIRIYL